MQSLIEFQIKNNTDAIIVCGTTGESATLSIDEKKELIKYTKYHFFDCELKLNYCI